MEISIDKIRVGNRTRKHLGDIAALANSIKDVGLLHPVVIDRNYNLIAGQRRIEAHKHLGRKTIESRIVENLRDAYELIKAERDENVCRLDFSILEALDLVAVLEPLERAAASERMKSGKNQYIEPSGKLPEGSKGDSRDKVADAVGLSASTIKKAKDVVEAANDEPDLFSDLVKEMDETGNVSGAHKKMQTRKAKKEHKEQSKSNIKINPIIELCDCIEWLNKYDQCDLLITDPPYSTDVENMDEFIQWLPLALTKVRKSGRAYVFIGAYPQEVKSYLSLQTPEHIKLEQMLIWTYKNTLGNNPKDRYKLNYQVCLYFKGIYAGELNCPLTSEQWAVMQFNAPDGRLGNRFHAWQKPDDLAEMLIRHSTKDADVVYDPFACTGTFLLAASKLGRSAFGCDNSENNLKIAIERGCERA